MVGLMKLKFDKYWEDYSDIFIIDDVFGFRLKFIFLEYYFKILIRCIYKLVKVGLCMFVR